MQRTAVINVVGLTTRLIGESTPNIRAFLERNRSARVEPVLPAVTCTAQSTYLTGKLPRDHGIVANGWYDREYAEHRFWK
jgi:predicted AlkP superfamily pyrophosphatase or phosphodiesterase